MMQTILTVNLWPGGVHAGTAAEVPRLEIHLPRERRQGHADAVVILPGGGYAGRAPHEGEVMGRFFASHGLVGIVAHYRVAPNRFPAPYADACRALRLVREMSGDLSINPEKIALMGFSAGGHLAATVATQPDLYRDPEDDLASKWSARPNRVILAYPVVSFLPPLTHEGSVQNFLGETTPTRDQRVRFSNELHVTSENPPAFLFHTVEDPHVPVQNSLSFASACVEKGVQVEVHIYPRGPHGVGLAEEYSELRDWPQLLVNWLNR